MTIVIRKGRAIVSALLLTAVMLFGMMTLTPVLPKAHAGGIAVASTAVVWAETPCIVLQREKGINFGAIVYAHSELRRVNSTVSDTDLWSVMAIGVTTGCPEGMGVLAPYVPHLAHYFGPWMHATRSGNGLTAAYGDRGRVCNVLVSRGGAAAVGSMYSARASYPLSPADAKRAAIAGTIAFCPWNLGILRAHFGG